MKGLSESCQRRGGIWKPVLFLAVFLSAALTLLWMLLLPFYVRHDIESRTGFKVAIGSLAANPFTLELWARDVRIFNSDEFPTSHFLDIASARLILKLSSHEDSRWRFKDADIKLGELTLITNENGQSNFPLFEERFFDSFNQTAISQHPRFEKVELEIESLELIDLSGRIPRQERMEVRKRFEFEYLNALAEAIPEILHEAQRRGYSVPPAAFSMRPGPGL